MDEAWAAPSLASRAFEKGVPVIRPKPFKESLTFSAAVSLHCRPSEACDDAAERATSERNQAIRGPDGSFSKGASVPSVVGC